MWPIRKKPNLTNTIDEEGQFRVSKRCSTRGLMGGRKLTEVTQDRADEGRLDNAEFAFHERKDLQNRFSCRETDPRHVLRTATISSTLGVFETRQGVEAISAQPRAALTKTLTRYPASGCEFG